MKKGRKKGRKRKAKREKENQRKTYSSRALCKSCRRSVEIGVADAQTPSIFYIRCKTLRYTEHSSVAIVETIHWL